MNNIVELGYPNIDKYFENLLEIQKKKYEARKEKWKKYLKDFFSKLIPIGTSMLVTLILNNLLTLDIPNFAKLIIVIGAVISAFSTLAYGFIFLFSLPLFFISLFPLLEDIMNYKNENERETLRIIKDDLNKYLDKSYFDYNSKGFIINIKRDDKNLCQEIENYLNTKLEKVI